MYKRKQFRNRIICTKENGKMATKYDSGNPLRLADVSTAAITKTSTRS
jgi:hypothetical protein